MLSKTLMMLVLNPPSPPSKNLSFTLRFFDCAGLEGSYEQRRAELFQPAPENQTESSVIALKALVALT